MLIVDEEPPVTWLLPVRNGMPHLPQALASVEAQAWSNQCILVRDNGSTDGSSAELRRWIPSRIRGAILTGGPLNLGESCAQLVEEARTEYCARIDADDVARRDRLQRQVEFLERHPEVVAVGSRVRAIDEHGRAHSGHGWNLNYYEKDGDIVHDLLVRAAQRHPTLLMRRSAVLAAGNYGPYGRSEDYELQLRLAQVGRLANLPEPLLDYRFHPGSFSQAMPDRDRYAYEVRAVLFAKAGAGLYGVDEAVLLRLKRREHPFALPALLTIARHLERRERIGLMQRVLSRSFLEAVRHLLADRDVVSRAVLGLLRRLRA